MTKKAIKSALASDAQFLDRSCVNRLEAVLPLFINRNVQLIVMRGGIALRFTFRLTADMITKQQSGAFGIIKINSPEVICHIGKWNIDPPEHALYWRFQNSFGAIYAICALYIMDELTDEDEAQWAARCNDLQSSYQYYVVT